MNQPDTSIRAPTLTRHSTRIRVAMMTTIGDDDCLHSRPMATLDTVTDDGLWFFTGLRTPVAQDILRNPSVNLCYVDSATSRYVSVVGRADLTIDAARIRALWTPEVARWFPDGIGDPDLALIHVEVLQADSWDASSEHFVRISGLIQDFIGD